METQDLALRWLPLAGLAIAGLVLGVFGVLLGGLHLAGVPKAVTASLAPPIWVDEVARREAYQARVAQKAAGYGWVDRPHGVARMPVSEAMRLVAGRGIAWRLGDEAAARRQQKPADHPAFAVPTPPGRLP